MPDGNVIALASLMGYANHLYIEMLVMNDENPCAVFMVLRMNASADTVKCFMAK